MLENQNTYDVYYIYSENSLKIALKRAISPIYIFRSAHLLQMHAFTGDNDSDSVKEKKKDTVSDSVCDSDSNPELRFFQQHTTHTTQKQRILFFLI